MRNAAVGVTLHAGKVVTSAHFPSQRATNLAENRRVPSRGGGNRRLQVAGPCGRYTVFRAPVDRGRVFQGPSDDLVSVHCVSAQPCSTALRRKARTRTGRGCGRTSGSFCQATPMFSLVFVKGLCSCLFRHTHTTRFPTCVRVRGSLCVEEATASLRGREADTPRHVSCVTSGPWRKALAGAPLRA